MIVFTSEFCSQLLYPKSLKFFFKNNDLNIVKIVTVTHQTCIPYTSYNMIHLKGRYNPMFNMCIIC